MSVRPLPAQPIVEISPEPSEAERAAIVDALARTLAEDAPVDQWWSAGVREAVSGTGADEPG